MQKTRHLGGETKKKHLVSNFIRRRDRVNNGRTLLIPVFLDNFYALVVFIMKNESLTGQYVLQL